MIQISNITKIYPSVVALKDVSLGISKGEFFGLLGPNGAGKTTLMSLLIGYLDPDGGEIRVGGERITSDNLEVRKTIGFIPQQVALYDDLSAEANLEIFGSLFNIGRTLLRERIKEKLNAVGLYERRKDRVKAFSGGMKRRLNMIASLLHDPSVLLCDEPTVGVDPQSRNAIFDYLTGLNREGRTIIYTTHYMEEAERLCNRVAIIDRGTIIAFGTTDELLEKLPFEEMISIIRNPSTVRSLDFLKKFGAVDEFDDHFELRPAAGFALSTFFARMEELKVSPRWIELHRPTLEALFLHLTGRRLRD